MQLMLTRRNMYFGGFIGRFATLGTRWDMYASRKILLKHFDARAAGYRNETDGGDLIDDHQTSPGQMEKPVCILIVVNSTMPIMLLCLL